MRGSRSTISMVLAVGLLAGSAVAVEAQDEAADPMAPAWVTGTLSWANHCEDPTVTVGDEVTQEYGYHCHPQTWTSDDPRLGGAADSLWNADVYSVDGTRYSVLSSLIDIHDENGGWSCRDDSGLDIGSGLFTTSVQGTVKIDCAGYGANDGLRAILVADYEPSPMSFEGLIFPGELPPPPDLSEPTMVAVDPVVTQAEPAEFADLPDVATVTDVIEVDERVRDLAIASPAVGKKTVRLMLPAGFDAEPDRTWPVLYLLHGQGGSHTDWTVDTSIAYTLGEELEALIVMPDADAGYYSDWWNMGEGGMPMWETFHIDELLPILEADWRAGDRRALAGISMGGFGAMSYAARHPDKFAAAASFSGVLDPYGSDWSYDRGLWGDKVEQAEVWEAHDPVTLAPALADTALYVWWGDGTAEPDGPVVDGLESFLAPHSAVFAERLTELGIEATVESGSGTHGWESWDEAVLRALPVLRSALEG